MDKIWYIAALVVVMTYDFADGAKYARCHMKGHSDTHGDICFREDEAGLFAHVHMWHHDDNGHEEHDHDDHDGLHEDGLPIHIHESAPTRHGKSLDCSTIGPHYNLPDDAGIDEGHLGLFSPNEHGAVTGVKLVRGGLSLSGPNSIIGRGVAVHTEDGKRCCIIKRCREATFNRMMKMMQEKAMNHNH